MPGGGRERRDIIILSFLNNSHFFKLLIISNRCWIKLQTNKQLKNTLAPVTQPLTIAFTSIAQFYWVSGYKNADGCALFIQWVKGETLHLLHLKSIGIYPSFICNMRSSGIAKLATYGITSTSSNMQMKKPNFHNGFFWWKRKACFKWTPSWKNMTSFLFLQNCYRTSLITAYICTLRKSDMTLEKSCINIR